MQILPSKCHKDVLKLQRISHFGPFNTNVSRIGVLWLMVESAGQNDGTATVRHYFTRSGLHNHRAGVILCTREEKEKRAPFQNTVSGELKFFLRLYFNFQLHWG